MNSRTQICVNPLNITHPSCAGSLQTTHPSFAWPLKTTHSSFAVRLKITHPRYTKPLKITHPRCAGLSIITHSRCAGPLKRRQSLVKELSLLNVTQPTCHQGRKQQLQGRRRGDSTHVCSQGHCCSKASKMVPRRLPKHASRRNCGL